MSNKYILPIWESKNQTIDQFVKSLDDFQFVELFSKNNFRIDKGSAIDNDFPRRQKRLMIKLLYE